MNYTVYLRFLPLIQTFVIMRKASFSSLFMKYPMEKVFSACMKICSGAHPNGGEGSGLNFLRDRSRIYNCPAYLIIIYLHISDFQDYELFSLCGVCMLMK